jgi:dipeptidyl aminopeptidase/acylaminoacyl peptidase
MKHKRLWIFLPLLSLVAAALGCNLPSQTQPTAEPTVSDAAVATRVAKTMQAHGGEATATPEKVVTATQVSDVEPVPTEAPEVLRVAFSDANRDLWVWQQGSVPVKRIDSGDIVDVKISPDGDQLLFARSADFSAYSLWVLPFSGGSERELVSAADFESMKGFADAITAQPFVYGWVPATEQIYFVTSPVFEGPGLVVNDDLWLVDAASGSRRALLRAGEGGLPYFAPDGETVMISTAENIVLMNADGSGREVVKEFEPVLTYSEYMYYPSVQWRSDSSLAGAAIPPRDPLASPTGDTWVGFLSDEAQLIKNVSAHFLSAAVFNQQLDKFVYLKNVGAAGENRSELRVVRDLSAAALTDEVFVTGNLEFLSWAPDGVRFAYQDRGTGKTMLGQVEAGRMELTGVQDPIGLAWIDDSNLLYLSRTAESWKMYTVKIGESPVEVAELGPADAYFPSYSFVK